MPLKYRNTRAPANLSVAQRNSLVTLLQALFPGVVLSEIEYVSFDRERNAQGAPTNVIKAVLHELKAPASVAEVPEGAAVVFE